MSDPLTRLRQVQPPAAVRGRIISAALASPPQLRPARRATRWLVPATSMVAVCTLLWLFWHSWTAALPDEGVEQHALQTERQWHIGPHLLTLRTGGSVRFDSAAADRVQVLLKQGAMHFEVAKLQAGQSFHVATPQLEIRVIGTRFDVEVDACSEVHMQEGTITVRELPQGQSVELSAGSTRRFCSPVTPPNEAMGTELVRDAMAQLLGQNHDLDAAAALFEQYLRQHPDGTLVQEALFHLAQIRMRQGQMTEARHRARRYLQLFPEDRRAVQLRQQLQLDAEESP